MTSCKLLTLIFLCAVAASTAAENITKLLLNESTPEQELTLSKDGDSFHVILGEDVLTWKFSLVLTSFKCEEAVGPTIEVNNTYVDKPSRTWTCPPKGSHLHSSGHSNIPSDNILDNLSNVTILLTNNNTSTYVTLVASIYKETNDKSCGEGFFDCNANEIRCPNHYLTPNGKKYIQINNSNSGKVPRRCIPKVNSCSVSGLPSCGYEVNVDEFDKFCHPEQYCTLIMFDWPFIVTRSLVAIIFVLIPAIVVFLLFHRRQVALQRARLHRQRQEQEAQREFNISVINKHVNDLPPTYEDLYDTKDPPPCFCAVQAASSEDNSHVNPSFQFECTCKSRSSDFP